MNRRYKMAGKIKRSKMQRRRENNITDIFKTVKAVSRLPREYDWFHEIIFGQVKPKQDMINIHRSCGFLCHFSKTESEIKLYLDNVCSRQI